VAHRWQVVAAGGHGVVLRLHLATPCDKLGAKGPGQLWLFSTHTASLPLVQTFLAYFAGNRLFREAGCKQQAAQFMRGDDTNMCC
jgi:hypothetical protein